MFGSCVTRDAASLGSSPLPVPKEYFSRCKLQSLVSSPTPVPVDDIGLASGFQTRVVLEDHRKTALPVLEKIDHALVIDLIDERFRLLDSGHGLVTDSLYLRNSTLPSVMTYVPVPEDPLAVAGGTFASACQELADRLLGVHVIVHRAMWATHTANGDPIPKAALAERSNAWLTGAYAMLEAAFPGGSSVTPSADVVVADPGHRWGLDAFHYIDDYYDDVARQFRLLLA